MHCACTCMHGPFLLPAETHCLLAFVPLLSTQLTKAVQAALAKSRPGAARKTLWFGMQVMHRASTRAAAACACNFLTHAAGRQQRTPANRLW